MLGGRRHQRGRPGALSRDELLGRRAVVDLLDQIAHNTPLAGGVSAVLTAPDRDAFLAAIERYPGLLTDEGDKAFDFAAISSQLFGVPAVTEWVRRGQTAVQAVREARS
jgi:hypothetical protein